MSKELIFVIGAHRSATSAFTGSLNFLGAALPARLLDANDFNPKGYFESKSVVAANDCLLAEMGRQCIECRPLPQLDGLLRERAVDRCEQLLRTEFNPSSPIVAVKDPRISLLTPVWIEAAQRTRRRTSFVLMLREPVASAASIIRRDGMSEEAAIALWLRYMFDAERHSRGCPRTIVRAESFVRDPVSNLDMVGAALGLKWPTAPEVVRVALAEFIDFKLLKPQPNISSPLADFATELHAAIWDLSSAVEGDETVACERIDTLRSDFDALCPKIHERNVFNQPGKAVTFKSLLKKAVLDVVLRTSLLGRQRR
jgi:hypothetical protein